MINADVVDLRTEFTTNATDTDDPIVVKLVFEAKNDFVAEQRIEVLGFRDFDRRNFAVTDRVKLDRICVIYTGRDIRA